MKGNMGKHRESGLDILESWLNGEEFDGADCGA
jgi:hypothetical protein